MRSRRRFPAGPDFGDAAEGPEFGDRQGPGEPGFADLPGFGGPGFHGRPGPHARPGRPGFAGPPGFGPWSRREGRRGRAKRGDVRAASLALLAEEPMNGYQIIGQISERSGGLWRPSPGSVYPALSQLEDENLIMLQPSDGGRRGYALTDEGREYVAVHAAELKAPWSAVAGDGASTAADMRALVGQVHLAAFQVVSAGTDGQVSQARKVLTQTRRALYRILAEDETTGDERADSESPHADQPQDGAQAG
jgi:DNA-binding PadR family transcriptional regulator